MYPYVSRLYPYVPSVLLVCYSVHFVNILRITILIKQTRKFSTVSAFSLFFSFAKTCLRASETVLNSDVTQATCTAWVILYTSGYILFATAVNRSLDFRSIGRRTRVKTMRCLPASSRSCGRIGKAWLKMSHFSQKLSRLLMGNWKKITDSEYPRKRHD